MRGQSRHPTLLKWCSEAEYDFGGVDTSECERDMGEPREERVRSRKERADSPFALRIGITRRSAERPSSAKRSAIVD